MNSLADSQPIIIDMLMGEPVPMETMLDDLATVRVIYLGEIHSIARHHRLQADILKKLAKQGLKLALGMEMFGEEQQAALEKWQSGPSGVDDLIGALGPDKWTNLQDYQSVLLTAKDMKVPIVGLNAPDGLVRKLAQKGVDGLSKSEREKLPDGFEEINPQNDRLLHMRLQVHKAFKNKSLDNIVQAQGARDATMARAVVRFFDSPQGRDRVMLVIAGSGHINYGFGIPETVLKTKELPFRIILITESGELVLSETEKRHALPVEITHQDLRFIRAPIADYLMVTPLKADLDQRHPNQTREPVVRK